MVFILPPDPKFTGNHDWPFALGYGVMYLAIGLILFLFLQEFGNYLLNLLFLLLLYTLSLLAITSGASICCVSLRMRHSCTKKRYR